MVTTSPLASLLGGAGPSPSTYRPEDLVAIRNALSGFVGKNFTDVKSDEAKGPYAYLNMKLGPALAQKLMTHAIMFNQRSDMAGLSPERRIQSFYSIGSNDPEVNGLLKTANNVAQGPVAGYYDSPDKNSLQVTRQDQLKNAPAGNADLSKVKLPGGR